MWQGLYLETATGHVCLLGLASQDSCLLRLQCFQLLHLNSSMVAAMSHMHLEGIICCEQRDGCHVTMNNASEGNLAPYLQLLLAPLPLELQNLPLPLLTPGSKVL